LAGVCFQDTALEHAVFHCKLVEGIGLP